MTHGNGPDCICRPRMIEVDGVTHIFHRQRTSSGRWSRQISIEKALAALKSIGKRPEVA